MSDVVTGIGCVVELLVGEEYFPVLCATDMSFTNDQEEVLKTGPNSGLFRERKPRLSDWSVEVSGLTPIEDDDVISFFYLLQTSVRRAIQRIRITFTDEAGNSKYLTGSVMIKTNEISAQTTDFANPTIIFLGTGPFDLGDTIEPPVDSCEERFELTLELAEGATSVQSNDLIEGSGETKSILWLARSTSSYAYTSGTPSNDEYGYDPATGTITFDPLQPGNPGGEPIVINYKRID